MPRVQILKYRDMAKRGPEVLKEIQEAIRNLPMPHGGIGRLHLEGKTIGDNPFEPDLRKLFASWQYKLDTINWLYSRLFADDELALDEQTRLERWRAELPEAQRDTIQIRVLQDPHLEEGYGDVEAF